MQRRTKVIAASALIVAGVAAGTGIAVAGGEDDAEGPDTPITGDALARAEAAALAFTGEGHVTGTEVGDEESLYEVEVTLDDGSQVDVQLDEGFTVVSSESDGVDDGEDE